MVMTGCSKFIPKQYTSNKRIHSFGYLSFAGYVIIILYEDEVINL